MFTPENGVVPDLSNTSEDAFTQTTLKRGAHIHGNTNAVHGNTNNLHDNTNNFHDNIHSVDGAICMNGETCPVFSTEVSRCIIIYNNICIVIIIIIIIMYIYLFFQV